MIREENTLQKGSEGKENEKKERRVFLKKAIYSAPILITLGSMTHAVDSAGSKNPPPPPSESQQFSSSGSQ